MQRATHQQIEAECLLSLLANNQEKNKRAWKCWAMQWWAQRPRGVTLTALVFMKVELGWSVMGSSLPVCDPAVKYLL